MIPPQILTLILGLLGGGGVVGVYTVIVGKAQRKATLASTKEATADAIIDRLREEISDLKSTILEEKKEKTELMKMYKECLTRNDNFTNRIHELEIEVQKLKNELIKANFLKQ